MALDKNLVDQIKEVLDPLGGVEYKSMFGGVGIFRNGVMFAKVGGSKVYLRVGEQNQADFEEHGMKPFFSKAKKKGMPYWEVPEVVLKKPDEFLKWAQKAHDVAISLKK